MFHSKTLDDRINKLHKRALRVAYKDDSNLTFEEYLEKENSFTTHSRPDSLTDGCTDRS